MTSQGPRPGLQLIARALVATLASVALGLVLYAVEPTDSEVGAGAMVLASLAFGWVVVGAYEMAAWGVASGLGALVPPPTDTTPERPTVYTPTRATFVLGSYFGAMAVVAGTVGLVVGMAIAPAGGPFLTPAHFAWIFPIAVMGGALAAWGVFRRLATPRDRVKLRRWLRRPEGQATSASVLGALLFAAVVTWVFPRFLPIAERFEPGVFAWASEASGWAALATAVLAVMVAPVVEELLFRGVFLEGLLRRFGRWVAIGATTAVFALAHVTEIAGHWPAIVAIVTAGYVLAELRLRTGSLVPSMAAHATYNATLIMIAWHSLS